MFDLRFSEVCQVADTRWAVGFDLVHGVMWFIFIASRWPETYGEECDDHMEQIEHCEYASHVRVTSWYQTIIGLAYIKYMVPVKRIVSNHDMAVHTKITYHRKAKCQPVIPFPGGSSDAWSL